MIVIRYLQCYEKWLIRVIIVLMALVLLLAVGELGWIILGDIATPPYGILEIDELLDIFGLFMLVLIGIELLGSIVKTYLRKESAHGEVVLAVAIIAISRKVIILDVKDLAPLTLVGIAAIIFALCAGFYFLRRARRELPEPEIDESSA